MTTQIDIPRSLAEATPLLTPWPVGLIPFQIRAQHLALQGAADAATSALPVVADYYVGASLDLPSADVPVNGSMLDAWGVEIDAVVEAARVNRAADEAEVRSYGSALVIEGVPFAASVLLNPGALSQLVADGTPVIIVPEPGIVVVGYAEDAVSLASLAGAAEESLSKSGRPVSATPLVRTADGWAPFTWPEGVASEAGRLRRRWDNVQYAAARSVVQAGYEAGGRRVFVADHALAEDAEGNRITYAALTGPLMLVPRADYYVLQADDGRMAQVPFASVEARQDVLVPAQGVVPEYFVVNRFPDELI
ncbi:hypothetical protein MHM582_2816 [Microbacterium sp. HM58-2]|nr:hypothetical protein MHM582_2816 [Microbacterium sp. HM58-2]